MFETFVPPPPLKRFVIFTFVSTKFRQNVPLFLRQTSSQQIRLIFPVQIERWPFAGIAFNFI